LARRGEPAFDERPLAGGCVGAQLSEGLFVVGGIVEQGVQTIDEHVGAVERAGLADDGGRRIAPHALERPQWRLGCARRRQREHEGQRQELVHTRSLQWSTPDRGECSATVESAATSA